MRMGRRDSGDHPIKIDTDQTDPSAPVANRFLVLGGGAPDTVRISCRAADVLPWPQVVVRSGAKLVLELWISAGVIFFCRESGDFSIFRWL